MAWSMSASIEGAPTTFEHRVAFGVVGTDVAGLEGFEIENGFAHFTRS